MSQSLAQVHLHLIFSTRRREPVLDEAVCNELCAVIGGMMRELDCPTWAVGAVADHVHVLFTLSRTKAVAEAVEELKRATSKWLKTKGPALADFAWQSGYGMFSVSASQLERVQGYILAQAQHHQQMTFQEELRAFLARNKVAFDERYLWD
jgi:REP element-mobilizing transposase RayT